MITSAIFVALAAICNAVMDKVTHHFHESIFNDPDKFEHDYWNAAVSHLNKYIDRDADKGRNTFKIKVPIIKRSPIRLRLKTIDTRIVIHPAFTDAWHSYKSSMITYMCAAIVLYDYRGDIWGHLGAFVIYGAIWNVTFSLFYKRLLAKK